MKKFLSLLLALTMVLSLVIVPARATDDVSLSATKTSIEVNETSTITAALADNKSYAAGYPTWSIGEASPAVATLSAQPGSTTATVTGVAAGNVTVTCTYKLTDEDTEKTATKAITVTAPDCTHAVKSITVNGIKTDVTVSDSGNTAYYYTVSSQTTLTAASFTIEYKTGFAKGTGDVSYSGNTLTIPVTTTGTNPTTGTTTITLTPKTVAVPTAVSATKHSADVDAMYVGQVIDLAMTAGNNTPSSGVIYEWAIKGPDDADFSKIRAGTRQSDYIPAKSGEYKLKGQVLFGTMANPSNIGTGYTTETTFNVVADPYTLNAGTPTSNVLSPNASLLISSQWTPTPYLKHESDATKNIAKDKLSYTLTSNDTNIATVSNNGKTINAGTRAGTTTVTATVMYNGKNYGTLSYTVTNRVLEATLSAVQNNTVIYLDGRSYSGNLGNAAQAALRANSITGTVSTVTLTPGYVTNGYIQTTGTANYYTFTGSSIGVAQFTGTVTTTNPTASYTMTFKVPVTPISTTYEAQYPEPTTYGNTYRYYVQVPSGASYYYVVGSPNQATVPTDFSQSGKTIYYTTTSTNNLYALTDSNFVNGTCTLWIVTKNSSDNKLYYGQLTVYQKNYNINYNGVAGETVQFKHTDFTNFMNEVSQARGDASKTGSYPYVTFNYVTFSYPGTQGTLYYNGTAMSNRTGSNYFNSSTKITNLDNVTFVPNAKTSSKTITLSFTLNATKYTQYNSSTGTPVTYSGSVVVSIVREDIKYTVAQGDTVRFTDSDFLTYLRSQSGFSNYTIDYVMFDTSAVSTDGVLYSYYSSGTNYGSAAKSTDKFYYNATSYNQNALSDVAFRASAYAKYGNTVYIPFTIYARYGSSGTGTRPVSGTVAIKIGQTMNFTDVKTYDYFYEPVKWAVSRNITNGTSNTTFSPNKACTRAEIVTFLWRAAGSPEPTITRNPFTDVNAVTHSSYYKAILWASQNKITSGTSATTFSPDQTCNRAQIVTFLYRYAKSPSGYYSNPFKDVSATNEASYYNAILWAVGKGITTGTSSTTFSPYESCNRAQAVTFLYRYYNGI